MSAITEQRCIWQVDDDDESWETSCGNKFIFIDGDPDQNGMKFCCYCGKVLAPPNHNPALKGGAA